MKKALLLLILAVIVGACAKEEEEEPIDLADLRSISITPSTDTVKISRTASFVATGTDGSGTRQDISSQVTWSSTDTAVATVSAGVATGVSVGSTEICAAYNAIQCDDNAALTVLPATTDIEITNNYGWDIVFEVWSGGRIYYENGYVVGSASKSYPGVTTPETITFTDGNSDNINDNAPTTITIDDNSSIAKLLIVVGVAYDGDYYYLVSEGFTNFNPSLKVILCDSGRLIDKSTNTCN